MWHYQCTGDISDVTSVWEYPRISAPGQDIFPLASISAPVQDICHWPGYLPLARISAPGQDICPWLGYLTLARISALSLTCTSWISSCLSSRMIFTWKDFMTVQQPILRHSFTLLISPAVCSPSPHWLHHGRGRQCTGRHSSGY